MCNSIAVGFILISGHIILTPYLINNLFKHPYTKIDFLVQDLQIIRQTASKYLELLVQLGLLDKVKIGKEYFFINKELFNYLYNAVEILPFENVQND